MFSCCAVIEKQSATLNKHKETLFCRTDAEVAVDEKAAHWHTNQTVSGASQHGTAHLYFVALVVTSLQLKYRFSDTSVQNSMFGRRQRLQTSQQKRNVWNPWRHQLAIFLHQGLERTRLRIGIQSKSITFKPNNLIQLEIDGAFSWISLHRVDGNSNAYIIIHADFNEPPLLLLFDEALRPQIFTPTDYGDRFWHVLAKLEQPRLPEELCHRSVPVNV